MRRRSVMQVAPMVFVALALAGPAAAQQDMGVITGLITDASGAAIPGARRPEQRPRP